MKLGSDKVVFLMHSVLNMNVRAPGIAIHTGPIKELYDFLINNDFIIVQIPCPETSYIGLRRWWFVKEQYDSVGYRAHCKRLAKAVCELAEKYYSMGKKLYFIMMGLSPTCGFRMTQSDPTWGGKPFDVPLKPPAIEGRGIFVEELEKELKNRNIKYKIIDVAPVAIYPPYRHPDEGPYPKSYDTAIVEVINFLID